MSQLLALISLFCWIRPYKKKTSKFRWEDGNNLTSNLFTLITPLTTPKIHQTYMYAHINLTQKKKKKQKNNEAKKKKIIILKKLRKKLRKKIQKLCDMYID